MAISSKFGTSAGNATVSGTLDVKDPVMPVAPPDGLQAIGPRVTFHFTGLWNKNTDYVYYDVAKDGSDNSYIAIKPKIPAGTALTDTEYWFKFAAPNQQVYDLEQTVETYKASIDANSKSIDANSKSIDANSKSIENLDSQMAATADSGLKKLINVDIDAIHEILKDDETLLNNEIKNRIAGDKEIFTFNGAKAFCFGDSNAYGQGQTTPWFNLLCDALQLKGTNYAVQGATWVTGVTVGNVTNSFIEQINTAPTDTTDEPVKFIFIMGGINDYHYGTYNMSDFGNAITNTINAAIKKYPQARIYVMMDSGSQLPNPILLNYEAVVMRRGSAYLSNGRVCSVPLADLPLNNLLFADQNHYSLAGARVVKARIIAAMLGGYAYPITPLKTSNTYNEENKNEYGFYNYVETSLFAINPYTCICNVTNYIQLQTGFGNGETQISYNQNMMSVYGDVLRFMIPVVESVHNDGTTTTTIPHVFNIYNDTDNQKQQASKAPKVIIQSRYTMNTSDWQASTSAFEINCQFGPTV